MFRFPVASEVTITPPPPEVEAFNELAIYISLNFHKIAHLLPEGTVTTTPDPSVIGPTLNPFLDVVKVYDVVTD
jgi:hypothetical protein